MSVCVLLPVCSNWQSAVSHGGLASEGIVNPSNENIKYVKSAKAGEFMNPIFAMKVIMLSHPCLPSLALSGGSINPAIWCLYSNAFSTSCRDPSLARGCSYSAVNVFGPYLPFKKIPDSHNACSKNCLIELIFELLKPKLSNTFFIKHMVTWVEKLWHESSRLCWRHSMMVPLKCRHCSCAGPDSGSTQAPHSPHSLQLLSRHF